MAAIKGPENFLFVYGSLAPGQPNGHILKPLRGVWKRAAVKGFLHSRGWGADQGFSGIELDNHGDLVQGQVFSSKGLNTYWEILDAFEGEDYKRIIAQVFLPNGKVIKAYIYALRETRPKP